MTLLLYSTSVKDFKNSFSIGYGWRVVDELHFDYKTRTSRLTAGPPGSLAVAAHESAWEIRPLTQALHRLRIHWARLTGNTGRMGRLSPSPAAAWAATPGADPAWWKILARPAKSRGEGRRRPERQRWRQLPRPSRAALWHPEVSPLVERPPGRGRLKERKMKLWNTWLLVILDWTRVFHVVVLLTYHDHDVNEPWQDEPARRFEGRHQQ